MKKNYITPRIKLSGKDIEHSICVASINTAGEITPSGNVGEVDEKDFEDGFEVGAKNRFYGNSDDSWE